MCFVWFYCCCVVEVVVEVYDGEVECVVYVDDVFVLCGVVCEFDVKCIFCVCE